MLYIAITDNLLWYEVSLLSSYNKIININIQIIIEYTNEGNLIR